MTQKDLNKLKKRLPKNYGQKIQDSLAADKSYTTAYISMVLNGQSFNDDIVRAAILVAEQFEEDQKNLAKAARGEQKLEKLRFNLQ